MLIRVSLFPCLYYAANAVYQGFIPTVLAARGFSDGKTGLIMGIMPLVSAAAQPAWGKLADQTAHPARLAALLSFLSAAALTFLPITWTLPATLSVLIPFCACFTVLSPMGDALVLRAVGSGSGFGRVRMLTSSAFALSSFIAGRVLLKRPGLFSIGVAGILAAAGGAAFILPEKEEQPRSRARSSFRQILRIPGIPVLFAVSGMLQLTLAFFFTFFPKLFLGLSGADKGLLGFGYLISSISEIPFLWQFDRLYARFGAKPLLIGSALALSLRYAVLALNPGISLILISQVLSGTGFAALTVTVAREAARLVPANLLYRAQTLQSALCYGVARCAGNLTGGAAAECFGIPACFLCLSCIPLLAVIVMLRSKPARP